MQRLTGNSDIVRVGVHVGVGCHLQPDVSFRFRLQDLLQFCATLDSPATVRAYLRDYLVRLFSSGILIHPLLSWHPLTRPRCWLHPNNRVPHHKFRSLQPSLSPAARAHGPPLLSGAAAEQKPTRSTLQAARSEVAVVAEGYSTVQLMKCYVVFAAHAFERITHIIIIHRLHYCTGVALGGRKSMAAAAVAAAVAASTTRGL